MDFLKLEHTLWLAILLVITLRNLEVYGHHFIGDSAPRNAHDRSLSRFCLPVGLFIRRGDAR